MLSNQAVLEYQAIYKKRFRKDLSFDRAKIEAEKFLRFFKLLLETKGKEYEK